MNELPNNRVVKKTLSLMDYISSLRIGINGSSTCYFIVLSLFPFLLLILSLLRYTGFEVEHLTALLSRIIPKAMMPAVERLVVSTYRSSSGTLVSVSAVMALWTASRGVHGILLGLNVVYDVEEDRNLIFTRIVSVLYTFAFVVVLILTLVLNVFGATLLRNLHLENITLLQFLWDLVHQRFILMMLLQTGLFSAMYMALPNRRISFRAALPGALLASAGWLAFSSLYSVDVRHFAAYANVYGSVYMVALSMLWLYFCLSIVFCGGDLNHYLATETKYAKGANYGNEK